MNSVQILFLTTLAWSLPVLALVAVWIGFMITRSLSRWIVRLHSAESAENSTAGWFAIRRGGWAVMAHRLFTLGVLAGWGAGSVTWWKAMQYPGQQVSAMLEGPDFPRLLDREGDLYATGETLLNDRPFMEVTWRDLAKKPTGRTASFIVDAVTSREDSRFFHHFGVDPLGICRAMLSNLRHLAFTQGASTITTQTVKQCMQHGRGSKLVRAFEKVTEVVLAFRLEAAALRRSSTPREAKLRIMAAYMNRFDFGRQCIGLGTAAKVFFNRDEANDLLLGEAAYLAGLFRHPGKNSAYGHRSTALSARDAVLHRMADEQLVTAKETEKAKFYVRPLPHSLHKGDGYLFAAVERELKQLIKSGAVPDDILRQPRVELHLTIDIPLQQEAESALKKQIRAIRKRADCHLPAGALDGAALVLENSTGAVLASVGGSRFAHNQYDLAWQAMRPVASIAKAALYARFMQIHHLTSDSLLSNEPLSLEEIQNLPGKPDAHESLSAGQHSIAAGLAASSNRMALRAGCRIGWEEWQRTATEVFGSPAVPRNLASFLGGFSASLARITSAYTAFARDGTRVEPYLIEKIICDGRAIYQHRIQKRSVCERSVAMQTAAALRQVLLTGTPAAVTAAYARQTQAFGKTGTSDHSWDLRMVGGTAAVTTGVWLGCPENQEVFPGASGGNSAAPVWLEIMKNAGSVLHPGTRVAFAP